MRFLGLAGFISIQVALAAAQVPIWVDAIFWTVALCGYFVLSMQANYARREQQMRQEYLAVFRYEKTDRIFERLDRGHERQLAYQDRAHEREVTERSRSEERKLLAWVIQSYRLDMQEARALLEHAKSGTQFLNDGYNRWILLADGQYINADQMPSAQFEAGQELTRQLPAPR